MKQRILAKLPRPLAAFVNFILHLMEDDIMGMTAQTSFFMIFSVFPLVIFVITILGNFNISFEQKDLEFLLPSQLANLLELVPDTQAWGSGAYIIPLLVSLWSASRGVWTLMRGIHRAFTGKHLSGANIKAQALTVLFTLCFVLALLIPAGLYLFTREWFAPILNLDATPLGGAFRFLGTGLLILLFISALYAFTPGCKSGRRVAPAGAAVATAIWLAVNVVFEFAADWIFQDNPLYSGVNTFLAVAMWLFIVSLGIIFGAEVNAALSTSHGAASYGENKIY